MYRLYTGSVPATSQLPSLHHRSHSQVTRALCRVRQDTALAQGETIR